MSSANATNVSGFTIVPLSIAPHPAFPHPVTHYLYIRPHTPKLPDPDAGRSLYVANIPVDSTLFHFRHLFAVHAGGHRVESVEFDEAKASKKAAKRAQAQSLSDQQKRGKKRKRGKDGQLEKPELRLPQTWDREVHKSGSSAVVVFVDERSAKGAMKAVRKAVDESKSLPWGGEEVDAKVPSLGSDRYRRHEAMRFPSHEVLQEAADRFMTAFGQYEEANKREQTRLRSQPDEDGFITVTRGGKEGPVRSEAASERLAKQRKKEKDKVEGMTDFYRFQNRERRKQAEKELLRKFDEDKKRVEEMRKSKGRKEAFVPM
ncbi:MAG: hypothetical protein Q9162_004626 [Coniocarpon cinnabarinum]